MNLKKPITFEEQVNVLLDKNLIIQNSVSCESFLRQVSYYRFSAYYRPFFDNQIKKCFDGTTFERIKEVYRFDQKLRNLILGAIEDVEVYLRTEIAYYHSHKYGAEGYMVAEYYNKNHNHATFLEHIESCITKNSKTLIVKHHLNKYAGHFPMWVIMEFFSLGMISHFYRDLIKQDKKKISQGLYHTSPEVLDSWMRCLTDLRNQCAHYSRLYYWLFTGIPKMPKEAEYIPTRRLFAQIYMLKFMYPDKEKWNTYYLKNLQGLIQQFKPYISLKHIDFPDNWESLLTNKIK